MENVIEYLYEGVRYIHKNDTLEIIFEHDIQEKMQNGDLPKDHFSWEVISFCRDDLVAYDKASSIKSGFKLNIFDLFSEPFDGESDLEFKNRSIEEYKIIQRLFRLPIPLAGQIELKASGINAYDPNYNLKIIFIEKESRIQRPFETAGFILKSVRNFYGLDYYQAKAFSEYRKYLSKMTYTENDHYNLVGHFKNISSDEVKRVDNRFKDLLVNDVKKIRLNITELENGDLELSPNINGISSKEESKLKRELRLINENDKNKTLHIGKKLVQLDTSALEGINEIESLGKIESDVAPEFLMNLGSFLSADMIDLDGFSYRVQGITEYVHIDFNDINEGGNDWFISNSPIVLDEFEPFIESTTDLDLFEEKIAVASENNADQIAYKKKIFNIPEEQELNERIEKIRVDLENKQAQDKTETQTEKAATFSIKYLEGGTNLNDSYENFEIPTSTLSQLKYQPYTYQKEAINWIFSLYRSSKLKNSEIKGGVLADDMGLGKTISSLLGLKSIIEYQKDLDEATYLTSNKCFMVVAPLSLLKNWREEINKFFSVNPFTDIVILNSQNDLKKFRYQKGNERIQSFGEANKRLPSNLKRCLKIGESYGQERLDIPGRLILTTYETMRDYQFSLAAMEFHCVIFDEAQKIKNPGTLATHAAKALNSDINIMATGTPVENNLQEYWCIMDTANPKLFGTKEQFDERFIQPIKEDGSDETKLRIGKELYAASGPFLLRRSKEELKEVLGNDLPNKYEFKGLKNLEYQYLDLLDKPLSNKQIFQYEKIRKEKEKDPSPGAALKGLHRLRACMIHPELAFTNKIDHLANITREEFWNDSAKLLSMLNTLHEIKKKNEKVIIFSMSRSIQYLAKKWLKIEFDLDVDIISGETKVESTTENETRLGKIKKFSSKPGFNIIILSPLAAGVGLNVVAANHIFHLERHWNPAKEAQANDRAYRIGQKKDVNIYYPISKHPNYDSFDIKLDGLLSKKTFIKDALITFPKSTENEIAQQIW